MKQKGFTLAVGITGSAQNTEGQLLSKYKGDYNPPFAANVAFGYAGELGNNVL